MKKIIKDMTLGLTVTLVLTSCAKQPTQLMVRAKAAIQADFDAKGGIYAKDELAKLNGDLQAALDAVNAQSKKFFKKYGPAKEMLAKLVADADAVKTLIPGRIAEAKAAAEIAIGEAKTTLEEAKALLEKAPKGKGTKADIEAMKTDLAGLETATGDVNAALAAEDYFGAKDKAAVLKDKAAAIVEQVNATIAKLKGHGETETNYEREIVTKSPNEPVYNIQADPKSKLDPLVLLPHTKTTIRFFIGPEADENITAGIEPRPVLDALAQGKKELYLTVTLFCDLSETDTYQQRTIKYTTAMKTSTSAEFVVTPSPAAVRNSDGIGKLIFVVDADGMEIDIIRINAIVGNPSLKAEREYVRPAKLMLDKILPEDISIADLIIAIAPEAGKRIPVVIRPLNNELLRRIREKLGDTKSTFWVFDESGVSSDDLKGLVAGTYKDLLSISDQEQVDLQDVYKKIGKKTEVSGQAAYGSFEKSDTDNILRTMRDIGSRLYDRIFRRGDPELRKAMDAIEAFDAGTPLRLKILARDIYVPWQIIYPDGTNSLDSKRFWGFRYKLGTLQLMDAAHGRTRTVFTDLQPGEVLFGAWRGIKRGDKVRELADLLKEHLEKSMGGNIQYCLSKDDFLSKIESGSKTIKLILAYGHGSSGTELFAYKNIFGKPKVIVVQNVSGPYFQFGEGDNETLVPENVDKFAQSASLDDLNPYFFKSQPIVILNACETGGFGTRSPDNNGFVGALTRAGARAIVVTEAPVWSNFAKQFGQDIIDSLLAGEDAQSALLKTRLRHLDKAGNPLGLLYSLYGNPGARIEKTRSH